MSFLANSRACDCASCRAKRDRDFCRILFDSYTTDELDALYPDNGLRLKELLYETAQGTQPFELIPASPPGWNAPPIAAD
jgi:hypothetical protein